MSEETTSIPAMDLGKIQVITCDVNHDVSQYPHPMEAILGSRLGIHYWDSATVVNVPEEKDRLVIVAKFEGFDKESSNDHIELTKDSMGKTYVAIFYHREKKLNTEKKVQGLFILYTVDPLTLNDVRVEQMDGGSTIKFWTPSVKQDRVHKPLDFGMLMLQTTIGPPCQGFREWGTDVCFMTKLAVFIQRVEVFSKGKTGSQVVICSLGVDGYCRELDKVEILRLGKHSRTIVVVKRNNQVRGLVLMSTLILNQSLASIRTQGQATNGSDGGVNIGDENTFLKIYIPKSPEDVVRSERDAIVQREGIAMATYLKPLAIATQPFPESIVPSESGSDGDGDGRIQREEEKVVTETDHKPLAPLTIPEDLVQSESVGDGKFQKEEEKMLTETDHKPKAPQSIPEVLAQSESGSDARTQREEEKMLIETDQRRENNVSDTLKEGIEKKEIEKLRGQVRTITCGMPYPAHDYPQTRLSIREKLANRILMEYFGLIYWNIPKKKGTEDIRGITTIFKSYDDGDSIEFLQDPESGTHVVLLVKRNQQHWIDVWQQKQKDMIKAGVIIHTASAQNFRDTEILHPEKLRIVNFLTRWNKALTDTDSSDLTWTDRVEKDSKGNNRCLESGDTVIQTRLGVYHQETECLREWGIKYKVFSLGIPDFSLDLDTVEVLRFGISDYGSVVVVKRGEIIRGLVLINAPVTSESGIQIKLEQQESSERRLALDSDSETFLKIYVHAEPKIPEALNTFSRLLPFIGFFLIALLVAKLHQIYNEL